MRWLLQKKTRDLQRYTSYGGVRNRLRGQWRTAELDSLRYPVYAVGEEQGD